MESHLVDWSLITTVWSQINRSEVPNLLAKKEEIFARSKNLIQKAVREGRELSKKELDEYPTPKPRAFDSEALGEVCDVLQFIHGVWQFFLAVKAHRDLRGEEKAICLRACELLLAQVSPPGTNA